MIFSKKKLTFEKKYIKNMSNKSYSINTQHVDRIEKTQMLFNRVMIF